MLVLLALLAMGMLWGHPFVQDENGIIALNPIPQAWSGLWEAFGAPYWPPRDSGELYRPLTIGAFTIQWMLGDGEVWPFRLVSLALYVAAVLLLWRFLRLYASPTAAWMGAAIFAVHPVHVEAVALAVNQAEIAVAVLLGSAVHVRLRESRGEIPIRRAGAVIWVMFAVALFIKEHALVLPGLLLATDLLLEREREPFGRRARRWALHYLLLVVTAAVFWAIRGVVLGSGTGTGTAEALTGLTMAGRAYTMLGVPAEWLRLLLWPAHLQGDWNLLEWVPTRGWSLRETAGVLASGSLVLALGLAWRRRPWTAFGIAWLIVTLAPVANILVPSGIILAERTLFLPSAGLSIIVADLLTPLGWHWPSLPRGVQRALVAGAVALLATGAIRSAVRHTAWKSKAMHLSTLVMDAPTSYRARLAFATFVADQGDTARARLEVRHALALRPDDPLVIRRLADLIRYREGHCRAPVIIYEELIALRPGRSDIRASLVACYLYQGRYHTAKLEADRGAEMGLDAEYMRYAAAVADSALRHSAPAETVRLRAVRRFTVIGPPPS